MSDVTDDELFNDDVAVSLARLTVPTLRSALLIKRRLTERDVGQEVERGTSRSRRHSVTRAVGDLDERFPRPRRLDVGAGSVRESGWVSLDNDPATRPDLLMDAHELGLPDESVDRARVVHALSTMYDPRQVLSELWRVLTPGTTLSVCDATPGADLEALPGPRHPLTEAFWHDVTRVRPYRYVPRLAQGRWELRSYRCDFTPVGERLAWKLKLTRDEVLNTFRNVSSEQRVELVKVRC